MDVELITTLSRIQFGVTAAFHIIFPTLLIGLSTFLSYVYGRWLYTNNPLYIEIYTLWLKILLLIYVVGAISGVALSAQLDYVFSGFYHYTQDALLPIRKIELVLAILLEGGCIGVMLLLTKPEYVRARFAVTLLFNLGVFVTAFLVVSRNSWMNTPAGVEWVDGYAVVVSYWEVVFNPSFPLRYLHMIVAGLLASGFFVLGVSAYCLMRQIKPEVNKKSMELALVACCVLSFFQILIGDLHGHDAYQNQPIKVAAMEGQWETERGAGFNVFAIPDAESEENKYELEIPGALSLLLTFDPQGEVVGLNEVEADMRPNVAIVFFSFRIMLFAALLMLLTACLGVFLKRNKRLFDRAYLRLAMCMTPAGLVAVIAGWIVAEVGRQPWVVYGVIKTAEIVSATSAKQVFVSMAFFSVLYCLLTIFTILYLRHVLHLNSTSDSCCSVTT